MDYFSERIFSDTEKKALDYSLWFIQKIYEKMTAGYFLGGGGGGGVKGGIFPLLTAVFPSFRLAVIIVYYTFQKILHPQDPPTTG